MREMIVIDDAPVTMTRLTVAAVQTRLKIPAAFAYLRPTLIRAADAVSAAIHEDSTLRGKFYVTDERLRISMATARGHLRRYYVFDLVGDPVRIDG